MRIVSSSSPCRLPAKADYLLTGNVRHFPTTYGGVPVVTPRDLLEVHVRGDR